METIQGPVAARVRLLGTRFIVCFAAFTLVMLAVGVLLAFVVPFPAVWGSGLLSVSAATTFVIAVVAGNQALYAASLDRHGTDRLSQRIATTHRTGRRAERVFLPGVISLEALVLGSGLCFGSELATIV